jgi:hypothetical protein
MNLNYSIADFCASNTNAETYHMDTGINLLVDLFGDWFTYNTLAKYDNETVNLVVGLQQSTSDVLDMEDNYIKIHVWINNNYIDQEIKFKNYGSVLIYKLDELVEDGTAIISYKSK